MELENWKSKTFGFNFLGCDSASKNLVRPSKNTIRNLKVAVFVLVPHLSSLFHVNVYGSLSSSAGYGR